jgi:hypothetical protein
LFRKAIKRVIEIYETILQIANPASAVKVHFELAKIFAENSKKLQRQKRKLQNSLVNAGKHLKKALEISKTIPNQLLRFPEEFYPFIAQLSNEDFANFIELSLKNQNQENIIEFSSEWATGIDPTVQLKLLTSCRHLRKISMKNQRTFSDTNFTTVIQTCPL